MEVKILYKIVLKDGNNRQQYYTEQPQSRMSVRAIVAQQENGRFNWNLHNRDIVRIEQYEVTETLLKTLTVDEFKEIKNDDYAMGI
jgi:hypothetical protein